MIFVPESNVGSGEEDIEKYADAEEAAADEPDDAAGYPAEVESVNAQNTPVKEKGVGGNVAFTALQGNRPGHDDGKKEAGRQAEDEPGEKNPGEAGAHEGDGGGDSFAAGGGVEAAQFHEMIAEEISQAGNFLRGGVGDSGGAPADAGVESADESAIDFDVRRNEGSGGIEGGIFGVLGAQEVAGDGVEMGGEFGILR